MGASTLVNTLTWVANTAYVTCYVPQIITNFRLKSGTGVSDGLLIGYLNLQAVTLFYVFLIGLPPAYAILVPIQAIATLTLIIQRLAYDKVHNLSFWRMEIITILNIAAFIVLLPFALRNPYIVGHLGGWGNVIIGGVSWFPQMFKVWRSKSVAGFDIRFVALNFFGGVCELIGAVIGDLPLQTKVSDLRLIILCLMVFGQFALYRNNHARQNKNRARAR